MITALKSTKTIATILTVVGSTLTIANSANALTIRVTIENLAPDGGVYFTPVWVGFHNGSFDSYNGGLSSQPGLERIAEDGNTAQVTADFAANLTYIDNSSGLPVSATVPAATAGLAQTGTRVQGTLGGAPIGPGGVVSDMFEITPDGSNRYFSYLSMILPSSDYYIANGNPLAHSLSSLFTNPSVPIQFNIGLLGLVNDAGTEVNDFPTSAGNGFFPGLPPGQTGPNQGADQGGVNVNVNDPFADFLNIPAGFDFTNLNFNDGNLYPNGIARVTISVVAVPEPAATTALLAMGGLFLLKRRQNYQKNSDKL